MHEIFIDWDVQGRPYMAMKCESGPVSAVIFMGYADKADYVLSEINKVVNELKRTPQKLIAANGALDAGLRKP